MSDFKSYLSEIGQTMESPSMENNDQTAAVKFSDWPIKWMFLLIISVVSALIVLLFLLYRPISTDLKCTRSDLGTVECTLVRSNVLLDLSPIKITDPLAADVITHTGENGFSSFSTEIRVKGNSYPTLLFESWDSDAIQNAADDINTFLHQVNVRSFSASFPQAKVE